MKNSNRNIIQNSKIKKVFFLSLVILGIVYFLFESISQTYTNYKLKKYGTCIKARVYARNSIGSKGKINTHYAFVWNKKEYFGISTDDDNYENSEDGIVTNNDLIQEDSIIVVFLKFNPENNRSNSLINKNCECDL